MKVRIARFELCFIIVWGLGRTAGELAQELNVTEWRGSRGVACVRVRFGIARQSSVQSTKPDSQVTDAKAQHTLA